MLRHWFALLFFSFAVLVTCEGSDAAGVGACGLAVNATCTTTCFVCLKKRRYDGEDTNTNQGEWGAAGQPLAWALGKPPAYYDGETAADQDLSGGSLPSAHTIATDVYLKARSFHSSLQLNQLVPTWALFMYYDMINLEDNEDESYDISCGDDLDPDDEHCTSADDNIPFYRAKAETSPDGTRVAINQATAYLDLSQVYGVSEDAALRLRASDHSSKLNLTTAGLPFKFADGTYLIADQRNAENLGTLALTTLLMREHNRKVDELKTKIANGTIADCHIQGHGSMSCNDWGEDEYFEAARQWTIADYEHSSKEDFFPTLLGEAPGAAWKLRGAQSKSHANPLALPEDVDPTVDPFFAAAGFRWLWSALNPDLRLVDENWMPLPENDAVELRYTNSKDKIAEVLERYGTDVVMRGLINTPAGEIDASTTSELIYHMTAAPVTDIQRARDLGVPDYNTMRRAYNLPPAPSFINVTSDATTRGLLERVYGHLASKGMDALVGALAEDLATGPIGITSDHRNHNFTGIRSDMMPSFDVLTADDLKPQTAAGNLPAFGPLLRAVVVDQFRRVYEGDKLWHIHNNTLEAVDDETVGKLVARNGNYKHGNSTVMANMPSAVFRLPAASPVGAVDTSGSGNNTVVFKQDQYWMTWSAPKDGEVALTFHIVGMQSEGYVGFGLGASMRDNADILFCKCKSTSDGEMSVICEDRYSVDNKMPMNDTRDDVDPAARSMSVHSGGTLTFTVIRKLDTGDKSDKKITTGNNDVIWSFNLHTWEQQHGYGDRGAMVINFYDGSSIAVQMSTKDFFALHGAIMLLAFGITAPAAMITARYFKHKKQWLSIHEAFGLFTAQASIPIAAAAMASATRPRFSTRHGKLGLAMFFLIILQAATGYIRMLGIENRGNKLLGDNYGRFHWLNTRLHRILGRLLVPLGLLQVYLGLQRISPKASAGIGVGSSINGGSALTFNVEMFGPIRSYLFPIWLGILILLFMWLEYRRLWRKVTIKSRIEQSARLPHYTQEKFDDCILQGCKWLIVNDEIFDMADYMKVHPGGSKIIKECIGMDVTAFIDGQRTVGKGVFNETVHRHTAAAYAAMRPNLVGYLQKHDFFTVDDNPHRDLLAKSSSLTSTTTSESSALQRGRGFGPRYATFEVVRRVAVPSAKIAAAAERPVYLYTLAAKEKDYKADLLRAGWYFKFRAISHGTMVQRQYTPVASHLLNDGRVGYDFYIRLIPGGQMSEILREKKPALLHHRGSGSTDAARDFTSASGSSIGVQGPFVIPELVENYDRIYMLAGGTGVAPMLQVVRRHVRAMTARRRQAATAAQLEQPSSPPPLLSVPPPLLSLSPPLLSLSPPLLSLPPTVAPSHGTELSATEQAANDQDQDTPQAPTGQATAAGEEVSESAPGAARRGSGTAGQPGPGSKWGAAKMRMRASRALAAGAGGSRRNSGLQRAPSMSTVTAARRYGHIMAENAHLEAIERRLLDEDGGVTDALLDFTPAAAISLIWQTHCATEGFCVADLWELAAASRGTFKYVQYAALADERDLRAVTKSYKRRKSLNHRLRAFATDSARRNSGSDASASPHPELVRGPRRRSSRNLSGSDDSGGEWKEGCPSDSESADTYGTGNGGDCDGDGDGGSGVESGAGGGGAAVNWFRRHRRRSSDLPAGDGLPMPARRDSGSVSARTVHPRVRKSATMRDVEAPAMPVAVEIPGPAVGTTGRRLPEPPALMRTLTLPTNIASDGMQREAQEARKVAPAAAAAADKRRYASSCSEGSGDEVDLECGGPGEQPPSRRRHSSMSSDGSQWQEDEDTSDDSGGDSGGASGGASGDSGSDKATSRFRRSLKRGLVVGKVDADAVEKLLAPLLIELRTRELTFASGKPSELPEEMRSVVMISGTAEYADAVLAILKELQVPKKLIFCLD